MENLQQSLPDGSLRALIQMATSAGQTVATANIADRLIKHADASRFLFLVDCARLERLFAWCDEQDRKYKARMKAGKHILTGRLRT